MDRSNTRWTQPEWLDSVKRWLVDALPRGADGEPQTFTADHFHIRPWSTVVRITTPTGIYYFKAQAPYLGHETRLTEHLARRFPDLMPTIVAVDGDRGWFVSEDAGTPLRDLVRAERSVRRFEMVVPAFVRLQQESDAAALLALGVPDRRLGRLPVLFEGLMKRLSSAPSDRTVRPGESPPEATPGARLSATRAAATADGGSPAEAQVLSSEELQRLHYSLELFGRLCERLASAGIPETIHHDDFHDGNIFLKGERPIFTDWGESAVAHPFFSLVVMLRGVENTLDVEPDAPEVAWLRDTYLTEWDRYASPGDLRELGEISQAVGYVNRALSWEAAIAALPAAQRPEYAEAVPSYLRDFIAAGVRCRRFFA